MYVPPWTMTTLETHYNLNAVASLLAAVKSSRALLKRGSGFHTSTVKIDVL